MQHRGRSCYPERRPRLTTPTALVASTSPCNSSAMGRRLEQAGFRVLLAGSVAEGTHVADGLDGPLDLLVADMGLPDEPAEHLARALRDRYPSLSVIYTPEPWGAAPVDAFGDGPNADSFRSLLGL
jgi:response regulator RpfG family c-di-GMP phosphodiesterase